MMLVPREVWVTANFKETQLAHMRPGQPVSIEMDAYPAGLPGTRRQHPGRNGAAFSLLPPENATGNYVKVVQRVPVKIVFDTAGRRCWCRACRWCHRSSPMSGARPARSVVEASGMRPAPSTPGSSRSSSMATFMEVLDTTIVNVALRNRREPRGGHDESTWILTSYLVSNAIMLPMSGWLSV